MKSWLVLAPILLLAILSTVPSSLAVSSKFATMTVLYTVTTQADADALPSDIDATGFDIAVLVEGSSLVIDDLAIHDATQYGVLVDVQQDVTLSDCEIYNIGAHTGGVFNPNGGQWGVAVYYYYSSGVISTNEISSYQKGGIVANNPNPEGGSVDVTGNTVTGAGKITYIAQNGIQFGYGATGTISGNTVTGNWYQPVTTKGKGKAIGQQPWVSAGILLYDIDMSNIKILDNLGLNENQFPVLIVNSASIGG